MIRVILWKILKGCNKYNSLASLDIEYQNVQQGYPAESHQPLYVLDLLPELVY